MIDKKMILLIAVIIINSVSSQQVANPTSGVTYQTLSVSGYTTCSDSTCRKDLYAGRYVNCGGPTFSGYSVYSESACANECWKESGCNYFTFYPSINICNLFITGTSPCSAMSGGSIGNFYRLFRKTLSNSAYNCKADCHKDIFSGQYISCPSASSFTRNTNFLSFSQCAQECFNEQSGPFGPCYHFKYYPNIGVCNLFLKPTCTLVTNDGDAPGDTYSALSSSCVTPACATTSSPCVGSYCSSGICINQLSGGPYCACPFGYWGDALSTSSPSSGCYRKFNSFLNFVNKKKL